jgi:uncharacterized protein YdeI (YjbR/CyaY-like superfamily)
MAHMQNPQVNAYIEKSADFARPLLMYLRELIHREFPELQEEIKWDFPNFVHKKKNIIGIAAFKKHIGVTFIHADGMTDEYGLLEKVGKTAMGSLGKIASREDLPEEKILIQYIGEAIKLAETHSTKISSGRKVAESKSVPVDLAHELDLNEQAKAVFEAFSNSHRNEYIDWINEAKREETRMKRIQQTVELLVEGKSKNWKYEKK